jgi:hypothetical protein
LNALPQPLLEGVESDEHWVSGQQSVLVLPTPCPLPLQFGSVDEHQSGGCSGAAAVDGEGFGGEASYISERRSMKRDRRRRIELGWCRGDEREKDSRVMADRYRDVGCERPLSHWSSPFFVLRDPPPLR